MERLITTTYLDLDTFVKDLIRFEEHIRIWEEKHPGYVAETIAEIDGGEFYSITIVCKKP
jgi:hypothetical protein